MKGKKFNATTSSLATYFVMFLIFILVRMLFLHIQLPFSDNANDVIATFVVQVLIMFGLSVFLFGGIAKSKPSKTFSQFGYKKISVKALAICLILGVLCYFFNVLVAGFFSAIIYLFGYESLPSQIALSDYSFVTFLIQIFTVCLLPAICEETAHRGLLLGNLKKNGIIKALLISSILFGLMHLSIQQFFYTAILGFIIGMSVVVSGSIFPGIIIHFMNNFLSTYFSFASANGWLGGEITRALNSFIYSNSNIFSVFLTIVLVLAIIVAIIIVLFVALIKETRLKRAKETMTKLYTESILQEGDTEAESALRIEAINNFALEFGSFFGDEYKSKNFSSIQKVWLASIFVMGAIVTISTFVWGIL
jgi:hypothetical protein